MAQNAQNTEDKGGMGPIVSSLLIVLVLIVAALYLFALHLNGQSPAKAGAIRPLTDMSDDIQSLHNDLNSPLGNI